VDQQPPRKVRAPTRGRLSLFSSSVLSGVVFYALLEYLFPYFSMWVTGSASPPPVPSALRLIYSLVFLLGVAVYVSSSDERLREFIGPPKRFLAARPEGARGLLRIGVLIAIPLLTGFAIWRARSPRVGSPTSIRIQHPTMPGKYEALVNPYRHEETEAASEDHEAVLREGTVLYETNCRPCHGVAAGGDGPMARFFRLTPANFRDPGFIATVVEPYAFWRVTEGGPGLPPVATPWDSAMPVWGADLTEEERWKVLLAEYSIAEIEPRKPEKLE